MPGAPGFIAPSLTFDLTDVNTEIANEYINYQVNYMMEKSSKKGTIPPSFDTREDSKTHD